MSERTENFWARLRRHLTRNAEYYWAPILYGIAVLYLYSNILDGEIGFGWDTTETYWPDLIYFSDQINSGEWPLWNPYDRGGYPFAADPQPGIYYPVHWFLTLLARISSSTGWWMIQFKMLLHHVIAGLCMHAFLRNRGLAKSAAVIGGIALIASTPWLIHKASNLLMPMVWTPMVWLATDRLLNTPTWRRAAALAAILYVAGSAGSPPGFFYVLVMSVLYGAFRVVETFLPRFKARSIWPHAGYIALALLGAGLLVLGLLWVGVAPGLELSEFTPRQHRDLNYALSRPLPTWPTIKALIVPTAGHVDAYCGLLVMMLGMTALLLRPMRDRGAPIFFAVCSVVFLFMSFGSAFPVLGFFVNHVPGFGLFRFSNRYKCLFAPMIAVLAAYGGNELLHMRPRFCVETWKVVAVGLLTLCLVFYLLDANPLPPDLIKRRPSATTPIVVAMLAVGLLIAASIHMQRARIWVVAIMPLLMLSDPERYWHHQQQFLEKKLDHSKDLARLQELDGIFEHEYRVYDEYVLEQRAGSRLQIRDFRGYPSGDPLDFLRYQDVLKRAAKTPELLEAYNVRYILHGRHHRNGNRSHRIKADPVRTSPDHFQKLSKTTRESKHPAALVEWYGAVVFAPKPKVLDAVLKSEDSDGNRHYAVLEEGSRNDIQADLLAVLTSKGEAGPASVAGTLVAFEADRIVVTISAPQPGLVVLNEVNYPGWDVLVDGEPAKVTTANYLLRAVVVDEGPHTIEWLYHPRGHKNRSRLYQLCMLFLLAAFASKLGIWAKLSKRRRS